MKIQSLKVIELHKNEQNTKIRIEELVSKEMRNNYKLIIASIASYERRKLQNYQIFHVLHLKLVIMKLVCTS